MITKLQQDGDIVMLADSRTEEGNMKLFGGNNPAAVAYLKNDFIEKNPATTQRIVNALLQGAQVAGEGDARRRREDRAGGTIHLGDQPLYLAAVKASSRRCIRVPA